MHTKSGFHWIGYSAFFKGKQGFFEGFIINAAARIAQITTFFRRNGVYREFFRQLLKALTSAQALFDRCESLLGISTILNQNMGGTTLLTGQVAGPLLVVCLQIFLANLNFFGHGAQGQGYICSIHLFRLLECGTVTLIEGFYVCICNLDITRNGSCRNLKNTETPGLVLNPQQLRGILVGDQATLHNTRTNLVDHILLAHGFTELANTHAQIAHRSHKTITVELSFYLKLGHLGNQGINVGIAERKALSVGILDKNLFLNQRIKHIFTNLIFIQQGRVRTLHSGQTTLAFQLNYPKEIPLGNILTVNCCHFRLAGESANNGVHSPDGEGYDQQTDDDLGNRSLGIFPYILKHVSPEPLSRSCSFYILAALSKSAAGALNVKRRTLLECALNSSWRLRFTGATGERTVT